MVLKELILTFSTLVGYGGLKELIFNIFYFGEYVWWFVTFLKCGGP